MKHTYLDSAQKKVTGWVKNARDFAEEHPLLMATGGLVGGALIRLAAGPTNPAAVAQSPYRRNEAVASSNTFSERPMLLGNMRPIQ